MSELERGIELYSRFLYFSCGISEERAAEKWNKLTSLEQNAWILTARGDNNE